MGAAPPGRDRTPFRLRAARVACSTDATGGGAAATRGAGAASCAARTASFFASAASILRGAAGKGSGARCSSFPTAPGASRAPGGALAAAMGADGDADAGARASDGGRRRRRALVQAQTRQTQARARARRAGTGAGAGAGNGTATADAAVDGEGGGAAPTPASAFRLAANSRASAGSIALSAPRANASEAARSLWSAISLARPVPVAIGGATSADEAGACDTAGARAALGVAGGGDRRRLAVRRCRIAMRRDGDDALGRRDDARVLRRELQQADRDGADGRGRGERHPPPLRLLGLGRFRRLPRAAADGAMRGGEDRAVEFGRRRLARLRAPRAFERGIAFGQVRSGRHVHSSRSGPSALRSFATA